jgi:hypothetical protein
LPVREAFISAGLGIILSNLGNAMHVYWRFLTIGHVQKV